MNFAVIGSDPDLLELVEAIRASTVHRIVSIADAEGWEDVLATAEVDAILIGGGPEDLRAEQLRRIAQSDTPALVTSEAHDAMLLTIELEMMRESANSVLEPYLPDRLHPAILELMTWNDSEAASPIGLFRSAKLARSATESGRSVLRSFARDADLLQMLIDAPTRVMAVSSTGRLESLTVHMHDAAERDMQWNVDAGGTGRRVLTINGDRGRATLSLNDDAPCELSWNAGDLADKRTYESWSGAAAALSEFADRVEQKADSLWPAATRLAELVDGVERSLQKKRMIDLHWEEHSESSNFKGVMAASGCLILMVTILLIVVVGVLGVFNFPWLRLWPAALLTLLGGFLLLQCLQFAFPANKQK